MGAAESKQEEEVFLDAPGGEAEIVQSTPGGSKKGPVSKLYRMVQRPSGPGGRTVGVWEVAETGVKWKFVQGLGDEEDDDEEDEGSEDQFADAGGDFTEQDWFLVIPGWAKVFISETLVIKFNDDQKRIDFYSPGKGPLALRLGTAAEYQSFAQQFKQCKFENTHKMAYTDANLNKVYGKEFAKSWQDGEDSDEVMWDADENFEEEKKKRESLKKKADYNEALQAQRSPLGLAMGAMDNSFMLHQGGIDVFRNEQDHVHSRGTTIRLAQGKEAATPTPRKGLLIRGETGMLLMSPSEKDKFHSAGLRQVDLEREAVVAQWKFEKDGTAINMRDVTSDTKGAQLEADRFTFMGLDDNRLCRWDMRDKHGIVQDLTASSSKPALTWDDGHQFSRGTNFSCFQTTGDGCVAVGSADGKIRLYSTTTMRQAKTSFPGAGAPITHIDVTYDGRWILATTDRFLILLNTMWRDEKGHEKCAFTARGGSNLAAPRLLKLKPEHVEKAGPGYKFDKACFSWVTEAGKSERHIVATVSKYSLVWRMDLVRDPNHPCYRSTVGVKTCTCYNYRELEESVVDSKFMHDKYMSEAELDAPLVVATPHKIASLQLRD